MRHGATTPDPGSSLIAISGLRSELIAAAQIRAAEIVGVNVRENRLRCNMSIESLAGCLGSPEIHVERAEAGLDRMSVGELTMLAALFQTSVSSFFDAPIEAIRPESVPSLPLSPAGAQTRQPLTGQTATGALPATNPADKVVAAEIFVLFMRLQDNSVRCTLLNCLNSDDTPDED